MGFQNVDVESVQCTYCGFENCWEKYISKLKGGKCTVKIVFLKAYGKNVWLNSWLRLRPCRLLPFPPTCLCLTKATSMYTDFALQRGIHEILGFFTTSLVDCPLSTAWYYQVDSVCLIISSVFFFIGGFSWLSMPYFLFVQNQEVNRNSRISNQYYVIWIFISLFIKPS